MAATCDVGNTKSIFIQQDASEQATYTILASNIFPLGFTVLSVSVDTQATAGGGATIAVRKDATTILAAATGSTASAGKLEPALATTPATRVFSATDNLVVITANANSQNLVVVEVCENNPRDVTVS
jgi:hypothetical protein